MKILGKELTFNNNKVYHAGDKPTASEIGAASSSHTHNYAGSSSAGGNANAAIKLATARTINGTSFDGSANITTANWGTARNIQIGNTAKSVNGSANVTWSLSEIGAAAASHGRHMPDTCETITDWNNATKNGWYMGNNATNSPTANAWYFGEVIAHNANYVVQTVYQFTASTDAKAIPKYIRAKMNGTWGAWTNVTVSKAVPSNAVFTDTNTWRGVQDNLTSTATDQSLSANQGKVLKGLIDGKAAASHTHNYAATSHNHGLLHDSFGVTIADTTTDNGWSMINGSYNGFLLKSIRSSASAPAWLQGNYSAGIAFGGADTKGVMSVAYSSPSVRFAGGNGSKPVWYFTVNGSSGKTYNMDSLAANTANTLVTARTINGTSFNGSANITTANWGTARTITIGNTGKSVNGSGNISWSLSEIGAAAASHTHNYIPASTGSSISIHADSDSSSTGEYLLLKAGHNELKIASSAGGTTVTKGQDKLTFNGNIVYHAGRKPTAAEIGAASTSALETVKQNISDVERNTARANHTHTNITNIASRGNVTCESGTARPSVSGASMGQVYNNGYPTQYGNVLTLKGAGDGQILVGWSGTDGAHAPVYVRSKRDTSTANWSGWAQVYTTAHKPTASDVGALSLSGGTMTGSIQLHNSANSWIGGSTAGNLKGYKQSNGSFHPIISQTTYNNHKIALGGIGNDFGFYLYDANRTANDIDGYFKFMLNNKEMETNCVINMGRNLKFWNNNALEFATHGGGWYMTDSTWIRAYGDKNIYTGGRIKAGTALETRYIDSTGGNLDINARGNTLFINANAASGANLNINRQWSGSQGTEVSIYNNKGKGWGYLGSSEYSFYRVYGIGGSVSARESKYEISKADTETQYDNVKALNIYNYRSISDERDEEGNVVKEHKREDLLLGCMVDELPTEVTFYDNEGGDGKAVDIYSYTTMIAGAVKHLIKKFEQLEKENEELKYKLENQEV